MENPIKMDDLGGNIPIFGNIQISASGCLRIWGSNLQRDHSSFNDILSMPQPFFQQWQLTNRWFLHVNFISTNPIKRFFLALFPLRNCQIQNKYTWNADFITPKFDFRIHRLRGISPFFWTIPSGFHCKSFMGKKKWKVPGARGFISFPGWVSPCIFGGGGWRFKCLCGRNFVGPILADDLLLDFGCVFFLLSFWEGTLRWLEVS